VRETKVLSLEEAVRKATSLPSQVIGLKDRGILKTGAFADIVVFDLDTIRMKGDNSNPAQPPEGIEYVLVNGKVVYKDMNHTGEKPGKVLRRKQQKIGDEQ
jgi:N-acyl-D-amino-acid deacylase